MRVLPGPTLSDSSCTIALRLILCRIPSRRSRHPHRVQGSLRGTSRLQDIPRTSEECRIHSYSIPCHFVLPISAVPSLPLQYLINIFHARPAYQIQGIIYPAISPLKPDIILREVFFYRRYAPIYLTSNKSQKRHCIIHVG